MKFTGGCYCGAIRYQSDSSPVRTAYCHCSICRGTTGAPVLAFAAFPPGEFSYTQGSPVVFQSSSFGQREFCGTCGTQICFRSTDPEYTVDVLSGSLDDPESATPQYHIFAADKLAWVDVGEGLPKYDEDFE